VNGLCFIQFWIRSEFMYRRNKTTPLNCWSEVGRFKTAVESLEQVGVFKNPAVQDTDSPSQQHFKILPS
jgi:hypothetical protein